MNYRTLRHRAMGLVITVLMTVCLLGMGVAGAFATTPGADTKLLRDSKTIGVTIDGIPIIVGDAQPVLKDGRVLIPFRAVGEVIGAEVKWIPETQTVSGTLGETTVKLRIGDKKALVGSREVMLDVPAQVINGRTLVPLRFVGETLGCHVQWDAATYTVKITTK